MSSSFFIRLMSVFAWMASILASKHSIVCSTAKSNPSPRLHLGGIKSWVG
jgi:hypothetical protein